MDILIAIIIALLAFVKIEVIPPKKDDAWLWWYMPLAALLYSVVIIAAYRLMNHLGFEVIVASLIGIAPYQTEAICCIAAFAIWMLIARGLRSKYFLALMTPLLNKLSDALSDKASSGDGGSRKALLPYFFYHDELKCKWGTEHCRLATEWFCIFVAGVYAAVFLVMGLWPLLGYAAPSQSWLLTSMPIIGLLPVIELYVYLCAKATPVEDKVDTPTTTKKKDGNLTELWKRYTQLFDNYAVAWYRYGNEAAEAKTDNISQCQTLFSEIGNKKDGIMENIDMAEAFRRLKTLFEEQNGQSKKIMIALDIPEHIVGQQKSYCQMFADEIERAVGESIKVYEPQLTRETLENNIVLTPIGLLLRQDIRDEWLKSLGVIVVISITDRGIANMFECRKFSHHLRSIAPDCRLLFVCPEPKKLEDSIAGTWLTREKICERYMRRYANGNGQYMIAYNAEDFEARIQQLLKNASQNEIYNGSEVIPPALDDPWRQLINKVHVVDVAYSNALEGREELSNVIDKITCAKADDINNRIDIHYVPIVNIDENHAMTIIYDPSNNAPAAYNKWKHLGRKENFAIVISKPYMLRDYFNANHDYFCQNVPHELQPVLTRSRITLAIILYHLLMETELEESKLRSMIERYYDAAEVVSIVSTLKELFDYYFGFDITRHLSTKSVTVFDGANYRQFTSYKITLTQVIEQRCLDTISVKDEANNKLFEILRDLLPQNYAEGQIHSFSGRPYEIGRLNGQELKVKTVSDKKGTLFYRPVQRIAIGDNRRPVADLKRERTWNHRTSGQEISFSSEVFETQTDIEVHAWYKFHRYGIAGDDSSRSKADEKSSYRNGKVMKTTFGFIAKQEYLQRKDDIRRGLQLLIYEVLRTFLPHHAQYLIVSTLGEGDADLPWIFNDFSCGDRDDETHLSLYFIEDATIDLGLLGILSHPSTLPDLLKYIYDYLCWIIEGQQQENADGYEKYLTGKRDRTEFLCYGRGNTPAWFDAELMRSFLRDYDETLTQLNVQRMQYLARQIDDGMSCCDFCGREKKTEELHRLSDGRCRCEECSRDAIDTDEQFQALCRTAYDLFKTHLDIDFSAIDNHGKLVSAVELHRLRNKPFSITKGYDIRKLIGMAKSGDNDFFVEDGYKPLATLGTICHELTHIWQYQAPEFASFVNDREWTEGLAVWTDLYLSAQYGESDEANEIRRKAWMAQDDEYGHGLRKIMNLCPNDPYGYLRQKNT